MKKLISKNIKGTIDTVGADVGDIFVSDTGTISVHDGITPHGVSAVMAAKQSDTAYGLQLPDGSIYALSEVVAEVLANPSATTVILSNPGVIAGYRCTVAAGTITIYDNTTASGKILVPTTPLAVGAFPIYGPQTTARLYVSNGITVVLSGASTVYIGIDN